MASERKDWVHARRITSAVMQALREAGFDQQQSLPIAMAIQRKLGIGKQHKQLDLQSAPTNMVTDV